MESILCIELARVTELGLGRASQVTCEENVKRWREFLHPKSHSGWFLESRAARFHLGPSKEGAEIQFK